MNKNFDCSPIDNGCSMIQPTGVDLCVERGMCNVRADVTVKRAHNVRIWGYVTDCAGVAVGGALVKLMRYNGCDGGFQDMGKSQTNCQGYYQFDLENGQEGHYHVLVGENSHPVYQEPSRVSNYEAPCPECGLKSSCRSNVQYR